MPSCLRHSDTPQEKGLWKRNLRQLSQLFPNVTAFAKQISHCLGGKQNFFELFLSNPDWFSGKTRDKHFLSICALLATCRSSFTALLGERKSWQCSFRELVVALRSGALDAIVRLDHVQGDKRSVVLCYWDEFSGIDGEFCCNFLKNER